MWLLEEKMPRKAVEEFKANPEFSVVAEQLMSDKNLKLYEDLSTQIQVVDAQIPLDRLEDISDFLRWTKRLTERKAPLSDPDDESRSESSDYSEGVDPDIPPLESATP